MDALVMCGGRGQRLDADGEKPLFDVGGAPMLDHVLDALAASDVEQRYAVTSPHVPETRADLADRAVSVIEAAGEGYVEDLQAALEAVSRPVMTVTADLPLLESALVDRVLRIHEHRGGSLTVCVPAALKDLLGVSTDRTFDHAGQSVAPTGINVVADASETVHVSYDARLAVNVNRREDARVAEVLR